jgi:two-component system phosphate regulon response regulator PhoB
MKPGKPHILLVEDEQDIRELIGLHLRREGYQVNEATQGDEGLSMIASGRSSYDLVVVDWMLPEVSGLEIVKHIQKTLGVQAPPVLMVTARVEAADIVLGLEAGADDYLTKPFEVPVLLARVRALLRRRAKIQTPAPASVKSSKIEELRVGQIVIRPEAYEVFCADQPIHLTPYEFKLFVALVQNEGKVLTREKLINMVQGNDVVVVDRAIDTHVFGLRKKLGDCAAVIETIRGIGYRVKDA